MLPELAAALEDLPPHRRDDSLALNHRGDHRARLEDLGEGRLAAMDDVGIDVSVLALAPPGTQALDPIDAVALSRAANDRAAAAVREYPSRLRALSTLPMSAPQQVAGELERAAGSGHVGTMVYGCSRDLVLDDPAYDDFFAVASALGQPIFLHPQLPSTAIREAAYQGFNPTTDLALATFGWGWHVDAATAALRLIVRGTFDRHPDLQLVLGHWGELLLFWTDRIESLARIAGLQRSVSDYLRDNIVITTSGILTPAMLHHVLSVTSIDRLIFSTDYPFQRPTAEGITDFLNHLASDTDRDKVSSTNAATLFGLEAQHAPR